MHKYLLKLSIIGGKATLIADLAFGHASMINIQRVFIKSMDARPWVWTYILKLIKHVFGCYTHPLDEMIDCAG